MYDQKRIHKIAALPSPILSVYLNTANQDPSLHPIVPAPLRWFAEEAEALSRTLLPRDKIRFREQVERIERFLSLRRTQERAIAAFVGPDAWEVYPLNVGLENQLRWGKPSVGQLFRLLSDHKPYGIAVVDHHRAQFLQFHLGRLTALAEKRYEINESQWKRSDVSHVASDRMRKAHGPDRDLFEHRVVAQFERLCRQTAEQLLTLVKAHDFQGLFLVGPPRLVDSIKKHFPSALSRFVVSVAKDWGGFSQAEIYSRLEPLVADYEQMRQLTEVSEILATNDKTVADPDETLARLQAGTIRTIVFAQDHDFEVRECAKCGSVSRSGDVTCADCRGERRRISLLDVLPRLAAEQDVKVEFVKGKAAQVLARAGGLGGWLRQPKKRTAVG
ncbi:MAG TPA: VLRF1 family aeRF1-type release factor [Candidatus Eisenbacteria bacterium]|jgi:protein required for attachment to host cells|nr:VLRF1 family aeRF1-type release factor [Bryobacteraceae bacterium]HXT26591.1 VLRF1 family aeRF1-type release factor [Candidatus Eisenbacteria bacterium]